MKVESNDAIGHGRVRLDSLTEGDTFLDEDGDVCLLTDEVYEEEGHLGTVVLELGASLLRRNDYLVTPWAYKAVPDED